MLPISIQQHQRSVEWFHLLTASLSFTQLKLSLTGDYLRETERRRQAEKEHLTSSCKYAMATSVGFPAVFTSGPAPAAVAVPSAIAANLR